MAKIACPKCNSKKLYNMQRGNKRCARCRYEFIPHKLPLTFTRDEWKKILHLFLREQSSNSIAEQTGFEQRRVLRALTKIRFVMTMDVPGIFSGTVEVDETYIGGQWRTNEKRFGTREQNEDEGPRNNRCLESFVEMVLSGLKLLMMLKLTLFKISSHKKYQRVLS